MVIEAADLAALAGDQECNLLGDVAFPEPILTDACAREVPIVEVANRVRAPPVSRERLAADVAGTLPDGLDVLAGAGEADRRASGVAVGAYSACREPGRRAVEPPEVDHVGATPARG